MDTKDRKQHKGNRARYENLVGLVCSSELPMSSEPEDDHGAYGDSSEIGEEQQERSGGQPGPSGEPVGCRTTPREGTNAVAMATPTMTPVKPVDR